MAGSVKRFYGVQDRLEEIERKRADLKVQLAQLDAEEVRLKQCVSKEGRPLPPPTPQLKAAN